MLFPVCLWRQLLVLLKEFNEVGRILKTELVGDLAHVAVRIQQQPARLSTTSIVRSATVRMRWETAAKSRPCTVHASSRQRTAISSGSFAKAIGHTECHPGQTCPKPSDGNWWLISARSSKLRQHPVPLSSPEVPSIRRFSVGWMALNGWHCGTAASRQARNRKRESGDPNQGSDCCG